MHKRSVRQVTPPTTRTLRATVPVVESGLTGLVRLAFAEGSVQNCSYIKVVGSAASNSTVLSANFMASRLSPKLSFPKTL